MECPRGFEAHMGWSSRCKNCFKTREEHSTRKSSNYHYYEPLTTTTTPSNQYQRRPLSYPVAPRSADGRTSNSRSDDHSRLLLMPSALQQSRRPSSYASGSAEPMSSYCPPEMKPRHSAKLSLPSDGNNYYTPVSHYATLPRNSSSRVSDAGGAFSSRVNRVLSKSDSTSAVYQKYHRQSVATMLPTPPYTSPYVPSGSYRKWSSASTPATPMRSPATTPRAMSPSRIFASPTTSSKYHSSPYYQTYSTSAYRTSRNNSVLPSPAYSRSSSRRSSITSDDFSNHRIINRDPFKSVEDKSSTSGSNSPYLQRKYSTNSLPRNYTLQSNKSSYYESKGFLSIEVDSENDASAEKSGSVDAISIAVPKVDSDGIQRKYRRTHNSRTDPVKVVHCSNKGCENHNKYFDFSSLTECWRCKQSSPALGIESPSGPRTNTQQQSRIFKTPAITEDLAEDKVAPLAASEDLSLESGSVASMPPDEEPANNSINNQQPFGNTLKALREKILEKPPSAVAGPKQMTLLQGEVSEKFLVEDDKMGELSTPQVQQMAIHQPSEKLEARELSCVQSQEGDVQKGEIITQGNEDFQNDMPMHRPSNQTSRVLKTSKGTEASVDDHVERTGVSIKVRRAQKNRENSEVKEEIAKDAVVECNDARNPPSLTESISKKDIQEESTTIGLIKKVKKVVTKAKPIKNNQQHEVTDATNSNSKQEQQHMKGPFQNIANFYSNPESNNVGIENSIFSSEAESKKAELQIHKNAGSIIPTEHQTERKLPQEATMNRESFSTQKETDTITTSGYCNPVPREAQEDKCIDFALTPNFFLSPGGEESKIDELQLHDNANKKIPLKNTPIICQGENRTKNEETALNLHERTQVQSPQNATKSEREIRPSSDQKPKRAQQFPTMQTNIINECQHPLEKGGRVTQNNDKKDQEQNPLNMKLPKVGKLDRGEEKIPVEFTEMEIDETTLKSSILSSIPLIQICKEKATPTNVHDSTQHCDSYSGETTATEGKLSAQKPDDGSELPANISHNRAETRDEAIKDDVILLGKEYKKSIDDILHRGADTIEKHNSQLGLETNINEKDSSTGNEMSADFEEEIISNQESCEKKQDCPSYATGEEKFERIDVAPDGASPAMKGDAFPEKSTTLVTSDAALNENVISSVMQSPNRSKTQSTGQVKQSRIKKDGQLTITPDVPESIDVECTLNYQPLIIISEQSSVDIQEQLVDFEMADKETSPEDSEVTTMKCAVLKNSITVDQPIKDQSRFHDSARSIYVEERRPESKLLSNIDQEFEVEAKRLDSTDILSALNSSHETIDNREGFDKPELKQLANLGQAIMTQGTEIDPLSTEETLSGLQESTHKINTEQASIVDAKSSTENDIQRALVTFEKCSENNENSKPGQMHGDISNAILAEDELNESAPTETAMNEEASSSGLPMAMHELKLRTNTDQTSIVDSKNDDVIDITWSEKSSSTNSEPELRQLSNMTQATVKQSSIEADISHREPVREKTVASIEGIIDGNTSSPSELQLKMQSPIEDAEAIFLTPKKGTNPNHQALAVQEKFQELRVIASLTQAELVASNENEPECFDGTTKVHHVSLYQEKTNEQDDDVSMYASTHVTLNEEKVSSNAPLPNYVRKSVDPPHYAIRSQPDAHNNSDTDLSIDGKAKSGGETAIASDLTGSSNVAVTSKYEEDHAENCTFTLYSPAKNQENQSEDLHNNKVSQLGRSSMEAGPAEDKDNCSLGLHTIVEHITVANRGQIDCSIEQWAQELVQDSFHKKNSASPYFSTYEENNDFGSREMSPSTPPSPATIIELDAADEEAQQALSICLMEEEIIPQAEEESHEEEDFHRSKNFDIVVPVPNTNSAISLKWHREGLEELHESPNLVEQIQPFFFEEQKQFASSKVEPSIEATNLAIITSPQFGEKEEVDENSPSNGNWERKQSQGSAKAEAEEYVNDACLNNEGQASILTCKATSLTSAIINDQLGRNNASNSLQQAPGLTIISDDKCQQTLNKAMKHDNQSQLAQLLDSGFFEPYNNKQLPCTVAEKPEEPALGNAYQQSAIDIASKQADPAAIVEQQLECCSSNDTIEGLKEQADLFTTDETDNFSVGLLSDVSLNVGNFAAATTVNEESCSTLESTSVRPQSEEKLKEDHEDEELTMPKLGILTKKSEDALASPKASKNYMDRVKHMFENSSTICIGSPKPASKRKGFNFGLMKSQSATNTSKANGNHVSEQQATSSSFNELLQERRRMLNSYSHSVQQLPEEEAMDDTKPDWMRTRESIMKKSQPNDEGMSTKEVMTQATEKVCPSTDLANASQENTSFKEPTGEDVIVAEGQQQFKLLETQVSSSVGQPETIMAAQKVAEVEEEASSPAILEEACSNAKACREKMSLEVSSSDTNNKSLAQSSAYESSLMPPKKAAMSAPVEDLHNQMNEKVENTFSDPDIARKFNAVEETNTAAQRGPIYLDSWGNPPVSNFKEAQDLSECSSDGLPSLTKDLEQQHNKHLSCHDDDEFEIPEYNGHTAQGADLPLGEGCAQICRVMVNAPSLDTISSIDSLDSSIPVNLEPEKVAPVLQKLRKKEKALRTKALELETKLEKSESHCYALEEENCELKTAIESLETEILEVQDRFHDEDTQEWRRMKSEVKAMAKTCRVFQIKLKKSEERSGKLKAENAQLVEAVSKDMKKRHHVPQQMMAQAQGNDMWKSAAIWAAVLVAGYQLLKTKVGT